jgi:hypothetical protein
MNRSLTTKYFRKERFIMSDDEQKKIRQDVWEKLEQLDSSYLIDLMCVIGAELEMRIDHSS